jgi:hypothetical protein
MSLTAAKRASLADKIAAQEIALKAELEAVTKAKKRAKKED